MVFSCILVGVYGCLSEFLLFGFAGWCGWCGDFVIIVVCGGCCIVCFSFIRTEFVAVLLWLIFIGCICLCCLAGIFGYDYLWLWMLRVVLVLCAFFDDVRFDYLFGVFRGVVVLAVCPGLAWYIAVVRCAGVELYLRFVVVGGWMVLLMLFYCLL